MKVLICDNGPWPNGDHRRIWAFEELVACGDIESFRLLAHGRNDNEHRKIFFNNLASEVESYRPDLILWEKDSADDMSESQVEELSRKAILVLHDGDPWQRILRPVPPNMRLIAKYARRTFLTGIGFIADQFPMAGDRIRYCPHGYCDPDILPEPAERLQRLVFIGSITRRWGRVLHSLGPEVHRGRTRAVGTLRRRLTDRFAAYGAGYPSAWGIKPCDFDDQFRLINESMASFTIDAAAGAACWFSNRTPFCLASGSIHIIIRRSGFDQMFGGCQALMQVADAEEAADAFEAIYSWTDARKLEVSRQGREFAAKNFRMPDLFRQLLKESVS